MPPTATLTTDAPHNTEDNPASPFLPSEFQLALALTINRAKPSNLSVSDYILLLRQCTVRCHPATAPPTTSDVSSPFDVAKYWRLLYHKSRVHDELQQNRVVELQRKIRVLEISRDDLQTSMMETAASGSKRKALGETSSGQAMERSKAMRTDGLSTWDDAYWRYRMGTEDYVRKTLLRRIVTLERITRESVRSSQDKQLAIVIERACESVRDWLLKFRDSVLPLTPDEESTTNAQVYVDLFFLLVLRPAVDLIAQGFAIVITRVPNPSQNIPTKHGAMIVCITSLFSNILFSFPICAQALLTPTRPTTSYFSSAEKGAEKEAESPTKPADYLPTLTELADTFLKAFLPVGSAPVPTLLLPQTHPVRDNLREALLYYLLMRAGTLVDVIRESNARFWSNQDVELAASTQALEDQTPNPSFVDKEVTAANAEARCLAPLLRYLLSQDSTPTPNRQNQKDTSAGPPPATLVNDDGTALIGPALRRLQATIIRGMYGKGGDQEPYFHDALKAPEVFALPAMAGGNKEVVMFGEMDETGDWFKEWLWEVVGWDIETEGLAMATDGQKDDELERTMQDMKGVLEEIERASKAMEDASKTLDSAIEAWDAAKEDWDAAEEAWDAVTDSGMEARGDAIEGPTEGTTEAT